MGHAGRPWPRLAAEPVEPPRDRGSVHRPVRGSPAGLDADGGRGRRGGTRRPRGQPGAPRRAAVRAAGGRGLPPGPARPVLLAAAPAGHRRGGARGDRRPHVAMATGRHAADAAVLDVGHARGGGLGRPSREPRHLAPVGRRRPERGAPPGDASHLRHRRRGCGATAERTLRGVRGARTRSRGGGLALRHVGGRSHPPPPPSRSATPAAPCCSRTGSGCRPRRRGRRS